MYASQSDTRLLCGINTMSQLLLAVLGTIAILQINQNVSATKACRIDNGLENGHYVNTAGKIVDTDVRAGNTVEARCNQGYVRRGSQYLRCLTNGQLSQEPPICEDIDECFYVLLITSSDGGSLESSYSDTSLNGEDEDTLDIDWAYLRSINCHILANCINTAGSYRCECGTGFQGDGVYSCQKIPEMVCASLEPPAHGSMEGDLMRVWFKCDKGYRLYGATYRVCVHGQWNGLHPICNEVGCGNPGTPTHGFKFGDEYEVGSRVVFNCKEGYELAGPLYRVCLQGLDKWSADYWSGIQPICRPIARSVREIANKMQTDFIDHLEVYTHSGRGRLAVSDNIGLDLVFAYDTSSSLRRDNFQRGLNFTASLLRQFGVSYDKGGVRVAVISFADKAEIEFTYGSDVNTFEEVIARTNLLKDKLGGGTALDDALVKVFDVIPDMRNGSKRVLFLMSDGLGNVGVDPAALAESLRRDEGVEIFVVAIGQGIDRQKLRKLASQPYNTHVFLLQNFEDLSELTQIIAEKGAEYKQCGRAGNLELPYDMPKGEDYSANPGAWPWLAQLLRMDEDRMLQCGAALLCQNWVITAGSCVCNGSDFTALPPEMFRVRLGAYQLGVRKDTEQEFNVLEVHLHADYDPYNRFNDIALIKLNQSANLTSNVRTLCIPTEIEYYRFRSNSLCYVAGWGIVDPIRDPVNESMPAIYPKQYVSPLVDDDNCKAAMTYPYPFSKHKICAGTRYQSQDACRGDRGAPLVCQQMDGLWAIAGVSSYSRECKDIERYAVFTRTSEFSSWIHQVSGNCSQAYQTAKVGGFHTDETQM